MNKLGKDRAAGDNARVWLENKTMAEYGFTPGSHFVGEVGEDGEATLKLCVVEDEDIVWGEIHTVSHKGNKSIVDLRGWWIKDIFDGYTHYIPHYQEGCIKLEAANE